MMMMMMMMIEGLLVSYGTAVGDNPNGDFTFPPGPVLSGGRFTAMLELIDVDTLATNTSSVEGQYLAQCRHILTEYPLRNNNNYYYYYYYYYYY
nr:hypothetical protein BaRGS_011567 [Batillaria attramentaria]